MVRRNTSSNPLKSYGEKMFCGYIALIGRPNVGKSTMLNALIAQKISITSRKPQTTRHKVLGIKTQGSHQSIYVDTPGIHLNNKKAMNKMMNKAALSTLHDVDVIVFITDGTIWREEDAYILDLIKHSKVPCILAVNKVDKIADKNILLPWLVKMQEMHNFVAMLPISAKTLDQVDKLEDLVRELLPEGPHLFGQDDVTDRSIKFLCAELLREKIFRLCGQELPYSTVVDIESYKDEDALVTIHAIILVEKLSHKPMIIGDNGQKLKQIATQARISMEDLLGKKVFLQTWCKVKSNWSDDVKMLKQLGFEN
jgi:GTPase